MRRSALIKSALGFLFRGFPTTAAFSAARFFHGAEKAVSEGSDGEGDAGEGEVGLEIQNSKL